MTSHGENGRGAAPAEEPSASDPALQVREAPSQGEAKRQRRSRIAVQRVTPGEVITDDLSFMRGHGTFVDKDRLISAVSGVVERVNKLIAVRPLKARYQGEVGDVVVGRVDEVGQKRWKVDLQGVQAGVLQLASINLPGGVQRRRTYDDQLNMRQFFAEHDLVCAEVHSVYQDGSVSLHTRSLRYGKLENGVMLSVPPALIKRTKSHFHTMPEASADVVIGTNGFIWLGPRSVHEDGQNTDTGVTVDGLLQREAHHTDKIRTTPAEISAAQRLQLARLRNAIVVLHRCFIAVYPGTILDVFRASERLGIAPKDMLLPSSYPSLTVEARRRRDED